MSRRLPSLNALRAFEASARLCSFAKAAAELNVTPGAISHQIKALEADLGLRLFLRRPTGLVLTEAGQNYQPPLRDAFDRLAAATDKLLDRAGRGTLTVSVSPNFAHKWLVPRLGRFRAAHAEIDLRIAATAEHVDLADVDLAVRHGDGRWPGLAVARLCVEHVVPVCAPVLASATPGLRGPADLARQNLLHAPGAIDWPGWLAHAGIAGLDTGRGSHFDQASFALEAAVDGQGLALARSALAAADLIAGRLVVPFGPALPAPFAYWIVSPAATAKRPKIAAFREWLLAEAAGDAAKLAPILAQIAAPEGRAGKA